MVKLLYTTNTHIDTLLRVSGVLLTDIFFISGHENNKQPFRATLPPQPSDKKGDSLINFLVLISSNVPLLLQTNVSYTQETQRPKQCLGKTASWKSLNYKKVK